MRPSTGLISGSGTFSGPKEPPEGLKFDPSSKRDQKTSFQQGFARTIFGVWQDPLQDNEVLGTFIAFDSYIEKPFSGG